MTSEQMNAAMAEIVQAKVKAKAAQWQPKNIKRIMLVLFGTAEPSIKRIMLVLALGAAALGIVGYYSYQEYKVDRMVERMLSEADSERDQQVVTLYVYKQHFKTDVPVVVNKIVDRYIHARGLGDLISRKRQEVYSNPFSAGLMTMIGCPIVQGLANSFDR
jgi:hypothetical protein